MPVFQLMVSDGILQIRLRRKSVQFWQKLHRLDASRWVFARRRIRARCAVLSGYRRMVGPLNPAGRAEVYLLSGGSSVTFQLETVISQWLTGLTESAPRPDLGVNWTVGFPPCLFPSPWSLSQKLWVATLLACPGPASPSSHGDLLLAWKAKLIVVCRGLARGPWSQQGGSPGNRRLSSNL
jgi:hypothetical protein